MNTRLLLTAACIAALSLPSISLAQQTNGPVTGDAAQSNSQSGATAQNTNANVNGGSSANNGGVQVGPVSSGSNSGAASQSNNTNFNGGNGPITIGPTTVGPQTATSDSDSNAVSLSGSVSRSEGGAGGSSTANSTATGGTATTGASTSSATANPNASNQGNAQSITFNQTTPSKTKLETTPQVYAPALSTTLTETCMGSTSGGISVMGFGGTLGTTWNDSQCVRRLNAREMAQTLGDRAAARALMCQDKDVAAAYAAVGQDCRQKYEVAVVVPPPAPISPVVINVPPAPAPQYVMPPVPNPPQVIYRDRPHRSTHKNVPACKVDPHYACPAHDD
jgi:hypothetical protein